MEQELKNCGKCKEFKKLSDFARAKKRKGGLDWRCRACTHLAYMAKREERIAKVAKRYQEKRVEIIAYSKAYRPIWEARHPGRTSECGRINRLKNTYQMTEDDFYRLLLEQDGKCAICDTDEPGGTWKKWQIDHDHDCCDGKKSCGKCIRGLLCWSCNVGLGHFDRDTLRKAVSYVDNSPFKKKAA